MVGLGHVVLCYNTCMKYLSLNAPSLVVVAVLAGARAALSAPIPDDVAKRIGESLPAAFVPVPASGANKIFPIVSEKRASPDRAYAISLGDRPFAVTAIGEGGKVVCMSVPAGLHTDTMTNRWFKAEDVFGKVKWKLGEYTPEVPCLAYMSGGKNGPELVAKVPKGTSCALLGAAAVGKATMKLAHVVQPYSGEGVQTGAMLVFIRENPPVRTQAEYDARAKLLMAEHAFRNGRPWGKGFPSILGNKGATECAAMAADFGTYMVDGGLMTGERFEKADEIRSGDMIRMKGHFFAVVYRKGAQLVTIEGNMNHSVCQSSSRYSVKGGKLMCGGEDANFEYGCHNWTPPK